MNSSRGSQDVELIAGYLKKQGPPSRPNWKKRYIVMSAAGADRKLSYYKKQPEDEKKKEKYLKGTIPLDKTSVLVLSASTQKKFEHSFAIKTPDRNYVFLASDAQDKEKWTSAILKVMAAIRDDMKKGGGAAPPAQQPAKPLPRPQSVVGGGGGGGDKLGVKATEPPPHLDSFVEDDSPPPSVRSSRPSSSIDLAPGARESVGSKITIPPSSTTTTSGFEKPSGSKIVTPQPSAFAQPSSSRDSVGFTSPPSRDSRSERERSGGSIFRKGGEGDISDKPLLRTAESASGRTGLTDRPGDRSSSYNVVREGMNLIPDYSENVTDSEEEEDNVDYLQKRGNITASGMLSWLPSWCPCAGFQSV